MLPGESMLLPPAGIMLGDPTHVCLAVRDVEHTASQYAALLGFGPWLVRMVHTPATHGSVRGRPASYTLKFAYCRRGSLVYELVETVEGPAIYREFLDRHGEGIHHVGFRGAAPLDQELARWRGLGIDALMVNRRDDPRYGWAYLDTEARFGCLLEIVCDPALGWWESLGLARDLKGPLGEV
jgi:methylmalonyl-CoA/ethylmalonyl-CoA epimerase